MIIRKRERDIDFSLVILLSYWTRYDSLAIIFKLQFLSFIKSIMQKDLGRWQCSAWALEKSDQHRKARFLLEISNRTVHCSRLHAWILIASLHWLSNRNLYTMIRWIAHEVGSCIKETATDNVDHDRASLHIPNPIILNPWELQYCLVEVTKMTICTILSRSTCLYIAVGLFYVVVYQTTKILTSVFFN